jgi:gamma-glutamyltranspeptidase / glutathione hydrolase
LFTTRPELVGDFGMVASTHWLASQTGMSVLERGGNAADAAVAAGFVLQVVEPHLNGPGGDVPILLWSEVDQKASVVCGQGVAPEAATGKRLRDLGLDIMPGTGHLPNVVPGAFGAWMTLLQQWGSWSVRDVLEPAIHYARHGHPLLRRVSEAIGTVQQLFTEHWPTSAETWLPGGSVPTANSHFKRPALAATYERIIAESGAAGGTRNQQIDAAKNAWYRGFVAEAIERYCTRTPVMDTTGEAHVGLMTAADLARWDAAVEEPVTFDYHNYTVCKTGPWGQGPVFLQQLALLQGFDLESMKPGSADWVHTIIEAGKLAFADREAWYGDPAFVEVPVADLLSPDYNDERRKLVGDEASFSLRPGNPGGRRPMMPAYPDSPQIDAAGSGEPTISAAGEVRGDTCHLDVVDSSGMMIAATPSGGWFQASPTVPDLGFCLSTRGQMFWVEQGLPNSIAPGKRPRTTLTPSLALRDGKPWLAFGTPGGDFQDQWTLHFFLNVAHGGLNLQEAIDQPEFHSIHMPNSFYPRDTHLGQLLIEGRFDPSVIKELERRGHGVTVRGDWDMGYVSAVAREGGWLKAAANPRGMQGYAVGR